jgi:hypothetical protein
MRRGAAGRLRPGGDAVTIAMVALLAFTHLHGLQLLGG